jgi:uncharacterized protein YbjT (DUF2867 family)
MKIIIPGGHGQVGRMLTRAFLAAGDECVVLTRNPKIDQQREARLRQVAWDGRTLGPWVDEVDGLM